MLARDGEGKMHFNEIINIAGMIYVAWKRRPKEMLWQYDTKLTEESHSYGRGSAKLTDNRDLRLWRAGMLWLEGRLSHAIFLSCNSSSIVCLI